MPKMANLEAKMANLAHFWEHLGDFFWILGAILPKNDENQKTTTVLGYVYSSVTREASFAKVWGTLI